MQGALSFQTLNEYLFLWDMISKIQLDAGKADSIRWAPAAHTRLACAKLLPPATRECRFGVCAVKLSKFLLSTSFSIGLSTLFVSQL